MVHSLLKCVFIVCLVCLTLLMTGCAKPHVTVYGQIMDSSNNPLYPDISYTADNEVDANGQRVVPTQENPERPDKD